MRRLIIKIIGLEIVALLIAQWRGLQGVTTDEAKYLLNIPYPHPPLLRSLMSWTEWIPFQEMLWRILMASLLIQAVWLIWDMGRMMAWRERMTLCASWLLCSAVILQAGSVMLSPMTALQGLVLLWMRSRPKIAGRTPALIGIFWLATLFTAYQGILFLPLVWSVLRRAELSRWEATLYTFGPVALLLLWSLSNPLALATMLIHRNEGLRGEWIERLRGVFNVWLVGGGGLLGAFATWGILRSADRALQLSALLVLAFVTLSNPFPFYAVLFAPLFVGGMDALLRRRLMPEQFPLLAVIAASSIVVTLLHRPPMAMADSRKVMETIHPDPSSGDILINGYFGHDWQFESQASIRRYKPEFANDAQAIVCLQPCEPMFVTSGWKRVSEIEPEVWLRK